MDIEDLAIRFINGDHAAGEVLRGTLTPDEFEALILEVRSSLGPGSYLLEAARTGFTAGGSGLGCRGAGDAVIHRAITGMLRPDGLSVPPSDMDDSGAVPFAGGHLVVSVDGLHSRLSRFPFLAGFHAARAALRDVMVMGARPLALTSDVHVANDADVGSVLDLTAGVSAVSSLTGVPVAGGSTLRIGGDMVRGARLTGSIGAVGFAERLTARRFVEGGDVLVMTRGSGGGTIATAAIYHGKHEVVARTMNVDFARDIGALLGATGLHALLDVTNGGVRGDAADLAAGRGIDILLDAAALRETVDPVVLGMLDGLGIDHLGISTGSILAALPPEAVGDALSRVEGAGGVAIEVGRAVAGSGRVMLEKAEGRIELVPMFREAPYTPLKRVVSMKAGDVRGLSEAVRRAVDAASRKAERLVREVGDGPR